MTDNPPAPEFVESFRNSAPYINAHRHRTFVVLFGGEAVADATFPKLIHDISLLNSLGVHLVLVHGARPQIEERLRARGVEIEYQDGLRITTAEALVGVKEAVGTLRVEIEALLSMGLANSPMAGAEIRVASGNFVTARPLGVRNGVDYCHTGEVRRVDRGAVQRILAEGAVALLSPLGYSPTGEVFNLSAEDVATAVAVELKADKLLCLVEGEGLLDEAGAVVRELSLAQAERVLASGRPLPEDTARAMVGAIYACRSGVRRSHLISRQVDGALLLELFTRDGGGTLITGESYEGFRPAVIGDVGGLLALLRPLEEQGVLVRRSRELLEMEIDHFTVAERDGMVVGCAALYPFVEEGMAELACLVVHPDYRSGGRGEELLQDIERRARGLGIPQLFVLTTHTAHWFRERGFEPGSLKELPMARQALYNYRRNSKVFLKTLA